MADAPLICTLRPRRVAAGLSQSALAERAGVSRQALIAIEAGRQVPSTSLALLLARALGCAVEDLFALPDGGAIAAVLADDRQGAPLTSAGRVALGRVDDAWVAHRLHDAAAAADGLLLDAASPAGPALVEPLADLRTLAANTLVAGCAPLLGLLADRLARRHREARATWIPANSARALDLLAEGRVHVAGLHLVDAPGDHAPLVRDRLGRAAVLVHLTRWRQGLVVAPGNPLGITSITDLARPDVRTAHREAGSGADALLRRLGATPGPGPRAAGHAEVARLVRWGVADAGVAIEAAAVAEGLHFIPLAEERFDLVVPRALVESEPVARLIDLLDTAAFRSEAGRLPGYDVSAAGHATAVEAE